MFLEFFFFLPSAFLFSFSLSRSLSFFFFFFWGGFLKFGAYFEKYHFWLSCCHSFRHMGASEMAFAEHLPFCFLHQFWVGRSSHLLPVLVCLGCHNKLSQTRWLKQQINFLTILEAWSPRQRCQQGLFFLRLLFSASHSSSLCVFTWSSLCTICAQISFYKDISHIGLGPTN